MRGVGRRTRPRARGRRSHRSRPRCPDCSIGARPRCRGSAPRRRKVAMTSPITEVRAEGPKALSNEQSILAALRALALNGSETALEALLEHARGMGRADGMEKAWD